MPAPIHPSVADFSNWVKWVFTASHRGRIGRIGYIKNSLVIMLAFFILTALSYGLMSTESFFGLPIVIIVLVPVYIIAFYRSITLGIQRLHDFNLSGWWTLAIWALSVLPLIGEIVSLVYLVVSIAVPGTKGPNRFGNPANYSDIAEESELLPTPAPVVVQPEKAAKPTVKTTAKRASPKTVPTQTKSKAASPKAAPSKSRKKPAAK